MATNPSKLESEGSGMLQSDESLNLFNDESIRKAFVSKVYCILSCQLLVTAGCIAFFIFFTPAKEFAIKYQWLYLVAFAVLLVFLIILACFDNVRRRFPLNFILLGVFTIVQSFALGLVSARFKTEAVLIAVGVTAFVVIALTIFALLVKLDFTYLSGILFVFVIVLIAFGILCAVLQSRYLTLIYSCAGALLFSVYLVVDTQLMLGGNHKYSLSPEEYIFAALNIYLDIVNLFLFILAITSCQD